MNNTTTAVKIMNEEASLFRSYESNGVGYDLFKTKAGGIFRIFDNDSGNCVQMKKYPSFEMALGEFEKTVKLEMSIDPRRIS